MSQLPVQFWYSTMHTPPNELTTLACHAEELGFTGMMGPDHLVWWQRDIASKYPYNDSGQVWWPKDSHWPDPWVAASAMAAVTTELRFGQHVFILPLRDPVNAAKQIATTSAIAGGRVVLAFGVGWMREEFELAGQPFERRGRRVDEMLDVLQLLWSGETVSYDGEFYTFDEIALLPIPVEPVPLIGSGHSRAGLRRAATRCDGWLGASRFAAEELKPILDQINEYRVDAGRSQRPFDVFVSLGKRDHNDEAILAAAELGVTALLVAPWSIFPVDEGTSLTGKLKSMDLFAKRLIGTRPSSQG